jgi:hypothetical protein
MSWKLTGEVRVVTRKRWLRVDRVVVEVREERRVPCYDPDPQPGTGNRMEDRWREATPMDIMIVLGAPEEAWERNK